MGTDRIEKEVVLRAPLERVWRAISDADEFGRWFGVRFDGPFVAGTSITGVITPTTVDEDVATMPRNRTRASRTPGRSSRSSRSSGWRSVGTPTRSRSGTDYSQEPTTLVEFTLAETNDGVLLRIVESGFDKIPAERRASAFEANSEGWAKQTELVRKYLALSEKM